MDQRINVPMRREQIRDLRGLINREMEEIGFRPAWLVGLLDTLDEAETAGTIRNARKGPWERVLELDRAMYPDQMDDLVTEPHSDFGWGLTGRMQGS